MADQLVRLCAFSAAFSGALVTLGLSDRGLCVAAGLVLVFVSTAEGGS